MLFGISHGNFEDLAWTAASGSKAQERYIATCATLFPVGQTSIFRHGIKVSPTAITAAFNEAIHHYDQLFYITSQYGFDSVVNLHTGNPTTGKYFIPGNSLYGGSGTTMQNWEDWVTSVLGRYAPGGSFGNGSTVSVYGVNQTMSGWTPKTRWEIWNEPNSPTGNSGDPGGETYTVSGTTVSTPAGSMNLADAYQLLFRASRAIRTHANAHSWTPYIIAYGVANTGGGMGGYWQAICQYAALPGLGLTYTVGGVTYGPNPHDFITALGIHPYSSADPLDTTGATGASPIKNTIPAAINVMNTFGGAAKRTYLTEWGWRGHNPANRYTTPAGLVNTEWEDTAHEAAGQGSQQRWEMGGVDVVSVNANTWRIDGACHYGTVDANTGGATANLGLFYDPYVAGGTLANPGFAGPIPDAYLKAVATSYRSKLLAPPPPSQGRAVNVLRRGGKIRVIA